MEEDGESSEIKSVSEKPGTSNSAKSVDSRKLSIPASSKPDVWTIEEEKQVRYYNEVGILSDAYIRDTWLWFKLIKILFTKILDF